MSGSFFNFLASRDGGFYRAAGVGPDAAGVSEADNCDAGFSEADFSEAGASETVAAAGAFSARVGATSCWTGVFPAADGTAAAATGCHRREQLPPAQL